MTITIYYCYYHYHDCYVPWVILATIMIMCLFVWLIWIFIVFRWTSCKKSKRVPWSHRVHHELGMGQKPMTFPTWRENQGIFRFWIAGHKDSTEYYNRKALEFCWDRWTVESLIRWRIFLGNQCVSELFSKPIRRVANFSLFFMFTINKSTCSNVDTVNPGLINPKRLFNWEGTIEKYQIMTIGGVPP